MKTNFRPRSNKHRLSRSAVVLIALSGGLAVLLFLIRGPVRSALAPAWLARASVVDALGIFGQALRSQSSLASENRRLMAQVSEDGAMILSLREEADSYDALLAEFGRPSATGTPAAVLVRPPESPFDTLVIDAGLADGVAVGDRVTTPAGMPIGRVSDAWVHGATVVLYSSSGQTIDAVLERGELPVRLVGRGGGNFEFDLPRNTPVVAGDRILSSNLDTRLVAVVQDVKVTPTEAEEHVYASSPVSLSLIRGVILLK